MNENIKCEIIKLCQQGMDYCHPNYINGIGAIEDIFINILNLLDTKG